jgi:hypothetical protein
MKKKKAKRRAEKWVEERTNSHRPDSMMEMNGESRRLFLFFVVVVFGNSRFQVDGGGETT